MLIRIQIRADGDTAHSVEAELYDAADRIGDALGLEVKLTEQVIEGTPGEGFRGRLSFRLVEAKQKVPVGGYPSPCPDCGGTGGRGAYNDCQACGGNGVV